MENLKTILIVDETQDSRRLLAIRLEGLGFKVLEAENPVQVQSVLRHEKVDIAVTEWALPGWNSETPLYTLNPAQRPVILFTDREPSTLPCFPGRSGPKAVISKKKRSELIELLTAMRNPVSESMASMRATFFGGKRILLVEDSTAVRHFIKRTIGERNPNWAVSEAVNSVEAIMETTHKPVDVVVLDLEIPGMDGPSFVHVMREKSPNMRHKPVVALIPCGRRDLRETFRGDPQILFLPKPVTASQVVETVESLFAEKKSAVGA